MELKRVTKEVSVVLIATLILALSLTYPQRAISVFLSAFGIILAIILINIIAKKAFAYYLETNVNLNLWSLYHYGFTKKSHFENPFPLSWMPILTSLLTYGNFVWMPIIEFDVEPRPERVSRRHGLYRYTEVTDWHIALIVTAGIFANVICGIFGYLTGFELFAKWSLFYAAWSLLPLGGLDGTKVFFGSKNLWYALIVILAAVLLWGLTIL